MLDSSLSIPLRYATGIGMQPGTSPYANATEIGASTGIDAYFPFAKAGAYRSRGS